MLGNDSDPDGDMLAIELVAMPEAGHVEVVPGGRLRITPTQGFAGKFLVSYRARDPFGGRSTETHVAVSVEPTARALVLISDGTRQRWVVVDTLTSQPFVADTGCGSSNMAWPQVARDGNTIVGFRCAGEGLYDLIFMRPRQASLSPPTTLLSAAPLVPNFVLSPDGSQAVVVLRIPDPADFVRSLAHELLWIQVPSGKIEKRLRLEGLEPVYEIRRAEAVDRLLVLANLPDPVDNDDVRLLLVDGGTDDVTVLSEPDRTPTFFATTPFSDDARFLFVERTGLGDLVGYDANTPGRLMTIWSRPTSGGFAFPIAFLPGTSTLLVRAYENDPIVKWTVWAIPLESTRVPEPITAPSEWWSPAEPVITANGQRIAYVRKGPTDGYGRILETTIADGTTRELTASPGLLQVSQLKYAGDTSDLVVRYSDPESLGDRLSLFRNDMPGVLEEIAPERRFRQLGYLFDKDATTVGIVGQEDGDPGPRVHLSDLNLPGYSVRLDVEPGSFESISLYAVLGPPLASDP